MDTTMIVIKVNNMHISKIYMPVWTCIKSKYHIHPNIHELLQSDYIFRRFYLKIVWKFMTGQSLLMSLVEHKPEHPRCLCLHHFFCCWYNFPLCLVSYIIHTYTSQCLYILSSTALPSYEHMHQDHYACEISHVHLLIREGLTRNSNTR